MVVFIYSSKQGIYGQTFLQRSHGRALSQLVSVLKRWNRPDIFCRGLQYYCRNMTIQFKFDWSTWFFVWWNFKRQNLFFWQEILMFDCYLFYFSSREQIFEYPIIPKFQFKFFPTKTDILVKFVPRMNKMM